MIIRPRMHSTSIMSRRAIAIACVLSSVFLSSCGGGSEGTPSAGAAEGMKQAQGVTGTTVPGGWQGRAPVLVPVERSPIADTTGVTQVINRVQIYGLASTTDSAISKNIRISSSTTALPAGADKLVAGSFVRFDNLPGYDDTGVVMAVTPVSRVYECDSQKRECVSIAFSSKGGRIVFSVVNGKYYAVVKGS